MGDPFDLAMKIYEYVKNNGDRGVSITDVSKALKINWRTAKKYLDLIVKISEKGVIAELLPETDERKRLFAYMFEYKRRNGIGTPRTLGRIMHCRSCLSRLYFGPPIAFELYVEKFGVFCPYCGNKLRAVPERVIIRERSEIKLQELEIASKAFENQDYAECIDHAQKCAASSIEYLFDKLQLKSKKGQIISKTLDLVETKLQLDDKGRRRSARLKMILQILSNMKEFVNCNRSNLRTELFTETEARFTLKLAQEAISVCDFLVDQATHT